MKNNIKSYLPALGLALAIITATSLRPAKAQQQNRQPAYQVIILHAQEMGRNNGNGYQEDGIFVYTSSSSQGALEFPKANYSKPVPLISSADALAQSLSAGFVVAHYGDGEYVLTRKLND